MYGFRTQGSNPCLSAIRLAIKDSGRDGETFLAKLFHNLAEDPPVQKMEVDMNKLFVMVLAGCLILSVSLVGCGQKKTASSNEAIQVAKSMETTKEKVDYLIGQAKAFYSSKGFQEAVDITQYVLRYLDKDSQAAKDLLEKAKNQLTAAAKGVVEDIKKGLGDFGK